MGYRSLIDVLFVFAVAVLFGVLTQRKGTIAGVSLSHGLINISLYLIFPFLLASPVIKSSAPSTILSPEEDAPYIAIPISSPSQTATPLPSQILPEGKYSIPITGSTGEYEDLSFLPDASSTLTVPNPTTCAHPSTWVEYIVQPGDTLAVLSARYGVSIRALQDANCLQNGNEITVGQQLYVPFSIIPSPTSFPSPSSLPPTELPPTQTPTKLPTPKSTYTPPPTDTPLPTNTPLPTSTQLPTSTPLPTKLPTAAETPRPTPTMAPTFGWPTVETPSLPTPAPTSVE